MHGYNRVTPWRYGWAIVHANDVYVGRSVEVYGEFSREETELLCGLVDGNSVVVEVGANIGAITVPLARKAGLVFAIEPQLQTYYALCGNLAMNSVGHKARAMNVAAGEERGCIQVPMLDLCRPVNVGGLSLGNHAAPETACETVAILPIDDLSLPQCRLLKVDVEGMELEVLKGAARTIERCQPILYVENDREDKSAALIEHIKGLGYQVYDHQPWLSSAENHNGVAVDLFPGIVSINLLCFPPGMPPGDVVQRMKRV